MFLVTFLLRSSNGFVSLKEFSFNDDWVKVVLLEHREIECGNAYCEKANDKCNQHHRMLVQFIFVLAMHKKEEVKVDEQLGQVLAEEGVRAHKFTKCYRLLQNYHAVVNTERIKDSSKEHIFSNEG